MDISSINSDLIRGNVTTIILKALWEEDRYGYDILREIEVKSQGQYKLKQPTLYSCLKRLEKQGLTSSYWGDESDTEGGRRRYYSLTEAGRTFVSKMQSEYEFSRTILDKLLSEKDFDFEASPAPFDINGLRPYTKRHAEEDEVEDISTGSEQLSENAKAFVETTTEDTSKVSKQAPLQNSYTYNVKGSSYDDSVRTTRKSMNEMLSAINQIVDKKEGSVEEIKDTATESVSKTISEETLTEDFPSQKTNEATKIVESPENYNRNIIAKPHYQTIEITPETLAKRDEAKKLLGLGYSNKSADKAEAIETTEKDSKMFFDILSKVPIDQQKANKDAIATSNEPPIVARAEKNLNKSLESPIIDVSEKQTTKINEKPLKLNVETDFDFSKSPVPPASTYRFRTDNTANANYLDAFNQLRASTTDNVASAVNQEYPEAIQRQSSGLDIKTKLYGQGYKVRLYTRENTEDYYSLNFINSNKLSRDCYAAMYAIILLEIFVMWLVFKDRFTPVQYLLMTAVGLPVVLIPFVIWTAHPTKRVHANFNFKTSILNRLMLYLNFVVVICLLGFFVFDADINKADSMINPILLPVLFLLNIPLSSLIYALFYNSRRYHIS